MKVDDIFIDGRWLQSTNIGGENFQTVGGCYWVHMRHRCRAGSSHQKARPSYTECHCNFTSFGDFVSWAKTQKMYGTGELDKDLLIKGNKVYGPDTCLFLPRAINNALVKNDAVRGAWPIGVCQERGKFRASLNSDGKRVHLGLYATPERAFEVYKQAKEVQLKRLASAYGAALDQRAFAALMAYRVEIND